MWYQLFLCGIPEYYMLCLWSHQLLFLNITRFVLTNCFCASVLQVGIWLCCDIKLILCGMLQFCVAISHQMWLYINFTGGHFVYGMHRFYRLQYNTVFVWYASIIAHLLFLYGMHQFYKWGISLGYHQMICVVCFNFTECFFLTKWKYDAKKYNLANFLSLNIWCFMPCLIYEGGLWICYRFRLLGPFR